MPGIAMGEKDRKSKNFLPRMRVRPAPGEFAAHHHVSLYAPVIVKYRDEKTDAATMLEEVLR